MITITGRRGRAFCDGVSRRDFLKLGGLAMGGLSMPQILQAEALSRVGKSAKSIIMIYMAGAPPHQDLFDLKMDAPLEYRGPYKPIAISWCRSARWSVRLQEITTRTFVIREEVPRE